MSDHDTRKRIHDEQVESIRAAMVRGGMDRPNADEQAREDVGRSFERLDRRERDGKR